MTNIPVFSPASLGSATAPACSLAFRSSLSPYVAVVALFTLLGMSRGADAQTSLSGDAANATQTLETIQVTGSWLGTGLQNNVKNFAGARSVVDKEAVESSGAVSIGDAMRRIPGVQSSDNSGTAGSAISLNIGVRGLTGRYSPRSTVLLDGIPLAVAPYGQPHLSFAPVSLANIQAIDVVRGGGAVRYGPQNVGGIINFTTRAIPTSAGLAADATVRHNAFTRGGQSNTLYSTFLGTRLDSGLGLALLYSGQSGSGWRDGSDERLDDLALKFRYELNANSEIYGKVSYYDVKSRTPGGLTVAQYSADPFQNTRRTDYWQGERVGIDVGYVNTISENQEFEVRAYYNDSSRESALINAAGTRLTRQPRDYQVFGFEPRYTQRFGWGATVHDLTVGYRYLQERGNDRRYDIPVATGVAGAVTRFDNATNAHAMYVDDRIAIGAWRITPGVRFERIGSEREQRDGEQRFDTQNNKWLPSLNIAYLLSRELTVFGNYGTSFGPVQNIQLNSQTSTNPLRPELAKTIELGARWQDKQTRAELALFRMRFDNQILQAPGVVPTTFRNLGATDHEGIEAAIDHSFDSSGPLAGVSAYANYTWTKAIQKSGDSVGFDVPFYSRHTGAAGARYARGEWAFNLSSTYQSSQYSDTVNTVSESSDATVGQVSGFNLWHLQASWRPAVFKRAELTVGVNNIADKRYYTRNVDGNPGRMVGAPRMIYVQGRYTF